MIFTFSCQHFLFIYIFYFYYLCFLHIFYFVKNSLNIVSLSFITFHHVSSRFITFHHVSSRFITFHFFIFSLFHFMEVTFLYHYISFFVEQKHLDFSKKLLFLIFSYFPERTFINTVSYL